MAGNPSGHGAPVRSGKEVICKMGSRVIRLLFSLCCAIKTYRKIVLIKENSVLIYLQSARQKRISHEEKIFMAFLLWIKCLKVRR